MCGEGGLGSRHGSPLLGRRTGRHRPRHSADARALGPDRGRRSRCGGPTGRAVDRRGRHQPWPGRPPLGCRGRDRLRVVVPGQHAGDRRRLPRGLRGGALAHPGLATGHRARDGRPPAAVHVPHGHGTDSPRTPLGREAGGTTTDEQLPQWPRRRVNGPLSVPDLAGIPLPTCRRALGDDSGVRADSAARRLQSVVPGGCTTCPTSSSGWSAGRAVRSSRIGGTCIASVRGTAPSGAELPDSER